MTLATRPAAIPIPVNLCSKPTEKPEAMSRSRMPRTTARSRSVPMCGFDAYRISGGAPKSTKRWSTQPQFASFTLVVSFPSEKVPAPPSPNCTLLSAQSSPRRQKRETSFARRSTSRPRSRILAVRPYSASLSAAKSPAGPMPTMTMRSELESRGKRGAAAGSTRVTSPLGFTRDSSTSDTRIV